VIGDVVRFPTVITFVFSPLIRRRKKIDDEMKKFAVSFYNVDFHFNRCSTLYGIKLSDVNIAKGYKEKALVLKIRHHLGLHVCISWRYAY